MRRKRKNATALRPLATCTNSASRSRLNCTVRRRTCALKPPATGEERRLAPGAAGHVAHHLLDVLRVGPRPLDPRLGLSELDRGDSLQRLRDLGDVLDGRYLPLEISEGSQALAPLLLALLGFLFGRILRGFTVIFAVSDGHVHQALLLGLVALVEVLDGVPELLLGLVGELLLLADGVQDLGVAVAHVVPELILPVRDVDRLDVVEVAVRRREDDRDLLLYRHRVALVLPEDRREALAAGEGLLRRPVQVAAELREADPRPRRAD